MRLNDVKDKLLVNDWMEETNKQKDFTSFRLLMLTKD